jgi:hypothetical protein
MNKQQTYDREGREGKGKGKGNLEHSTIKAMLNYATNCQLGDEFIK